MCIEQSIPDFTIEKMVDEQNNFIERNVENDED